MTTSASTTSSAPSSETTATTPSGLAARPRRLSRPEHGRMLAGVAAGIARYLHVDVIFVRIALVVSVFVGGVGIPLYLASWLLMPSDDAVESIAGEFASSVSAWRN